MAREFVGCRLTSRGIESTYVDAATPEVALLATLTFPAKDRLSRLIAEADASERELDIIIHVLMPLAEPPPGRRAVVGELSRWHVEPALDLLAAGELPHYREHGVDPSGRP